MCTPFGLFISLVILAGTVQPALAQQVDRPERMEAALGKPTGGDPSAREASTRLVPGLQPDRTILLPNQWSIKPAGEHVELGDTPTNIAMHPTEPYAAIIHCGQGEHEVIVVDLKTRRVACRVPVLQSFYGVTFDRSGKRLFASGGEHDVIHSWAFGSGLLSDPKSTRAVPEGEAFVVTGLRTTLDDQAILACGSFGGKLAIMPFDQSKKAQMVEFGPDTFPYLAIPSPDGSRYFVSLWGAGTVAVVNAQTLSIEARWPTPPHPTEMVLTPDGGRLFVSCANSNEAVSIDPATGKVLEVISSALFPGAEAGSTPTSLAISSDGKLLAIANACNNNLAIVNIEQPAKAKPLGFVPTGWYPTSVRFGPGGELYVANGKGLSPKANPHGPNPERPVPRTLQEYIAGIFTGSLSIIRPIQPDTLATMTADAFRCSPLMAESGVRNAGREADNPIPAAVGGSSPIKHCIYIIKENRTYDQVFGDMPQGNGAPELCLFPDRVTPNHHALAREFVLLDNFYVDSEVSADGHEWSMGAYASDFVEKVWPMTYRANRPKQSEREFNYPAEGNYAIAVPAGGYIWDRCKQAGVSYRSYGEWVENGPQVGDPGTAKAEALVGHIDPYFRSYDLNYPDVKRAERFIEELKGFEAKDEMPQFMIVRIPNDHTAGTRRGAPTPTAMVADNDLALGMLVEAISKSKFWKETAIFVTEDDAQNGPDHVDAHRAVALVVSPYTKRGVVDSSMYSTASMLRTMELILGLRPMSQFDAAALPMYNSFTGKPDFTPYACKPAGVDLNAKNVAGAWGQETSHELDLAREDAADDLVFNEIIWKSVKGADSSMPAPVRAAFVFAHADKPDDDDDD